MILCKWLAQDARTGDKGAAGDGKKLPRIRNVVPYTASAGMLPRSSLSVARSNNNKRGNPLVQQELPLSLRRQWRYSTIPFAKG